MDEKPAFSDLLRRLDPTLGVAEAVPVYQAFRLRRTVHAKGSLMRRLKALRPNVGPMAVVGAVLGTILAVGAILVLGCLAIPLVAVVAVVASTAFRGKRRTEHVLPRGTGAVFAPGGFLQDAAIDLWLAGVGGRDVLLAMYAERREGRGIAGALFLLGLYVCFAVSYFHFGKQVHWAGFVLAAVALWLTVEIWLSGMTSSGNGIRMRYLEPQLFVWEKGGVGGAGELAALRLGRAFLTLLISGCVIAPVAIGLAVATAALAEAVPAAHLKTVLALLYGAVLAAAAVALRLWRPRGARKLLAENEKLLARGDAAFDRFMAGTVVQDPDGAAWARWRHGLPAGHPPSALATSAAPPAALLTPPPPPLAPPPLPPAE